MCPKPQPLVHLCPAAEWAAARVAGEVRAESLGTVGFVHLSTRQQVHLPANRLFAGRSDVVLLYVHPDRLDAPLRWEPGLPEDPPTLRFPHLYGPLPTSAVIAVSSYLPGSDGRFAPIG
ncbi:MAG TPA: DUF952 domain-containing protein [Mycobacterium sp.]|jgi:uncharacterized protein (DUF952 family)|nr:DUF952 domain-containing protein [Mycobacterium sp.]